MAKVKCKGTALKQQIAMSYTAVAQLISLSMSGSESLTYDSTTLDGGVEKTYDQTGYTEPGECSGELFYDPALSGHQSMTDLLAAPADQNWQILYADSGGTTQTFAGAGIAFGNTVDMADGLKGSFTIKIDGTAGWPT
jgi:hypothetical protein